MDGKIKPKILAVVGATASGKTSLGVELAKKYGGEIISADSMQIYKGLDIASAKPTPEEMQGIPHHLIDFLERDVIFSVSDYVNLANEKIKEILGRGKLPIIVGGTGLYIDSLLNNIRFSDGGSDEAYREKLYTLAREKGNGYLYNILLETDPVSAESIHMNNLVRVIRESPYDSLIIGLDFHDRQILYDRINMRVDEMVKNGLVEEAERLWKTGCQKTASNAIGYKELIPYFENIMTLDECLDRIKQETRRYAKRQLTWFRKNTRIQWIFLDEINKKSEISEKSEKTIENYWNV